MQHINYVGLAELFGKHNQFILTTHVNPDGDAIGSVIACYGILKELGKDVRIINFSETPFFLTFLDPENVIERYSEEKHNDDLLNAEALVALDFNRLDRTVKMKSVISNSSAVKICIDHHQEPEQVYDYILTDITACATAHLLYRLIKQTGLCKLNFQIAQGIYAGVMTDTGSFRFFRTTPEVHHLAAELLEYGVDPQTVYNKIYDNSSFGRLKMLGEALQSIQLYGEDQSVAVMRLYRDIREGYGVAEYDTEGFVNMCMSISTVKIAVKIMEVTPGIKISLRSKGNIPVHQLAAQFDGGGHMNAAGIRLRTTEKIADIEERIINAALQLASEHQI